MSRYQHDADATASARLRPRAHRHYRNSQPSIGAEAKRSTQTRTKVRDEPAECLFRDRGCRVATRFSSTQTQRPNSSGSFAARSWGSCTKSNKGKHAHFRRICWLWGAIGRHYRLNSGLSARIINQGEAISACPQLARRSLWRNIRLHDLVSDAVLATRSSSAFTVT